jgi:hypothetical protein
MLQVWLQVKSSQWVSGMRSDRIERRRHLLHFLRFLASPCSIHSSILFLCFFRMQIIQDGLFLGRRSETTPRSGNDIEFSTSSEFASVPYTLSVRLTSSSHHVQCTNPQNPTPHHTLLDKTHPNLYPPPVPSVGTRMPCSSPTNLSPYPPSRSRRKRNMLPLFPQLSPN